MGPFPSCCNLRGREGGSEGHWTGALPRHSGGTIRYKESTSILKAAQDKNVWFMVNVDKEHDIAKNWRDTHTKKDDTVKLRTVPKADCERLLRLPPLGYTHWMGLLGLALAIYWYYQCPS